MGSDQIAADRGHRTQIIVAVIGGLATVATTVLAARAGDGPAGPDKVATPRLSAAAQALIDKPAKCYSVTVNAPRNESVMIESPAPGAEVEEIPTVRGTAKLVNGEQLYFFTYAPGICMYYFDPYNALAPAPDGSWSHTPNVTHNVGQEVVFIAAVVDPDGQRHLNEILGLPYTEEGPFLLRLPDGTRAAHIKVRVRAK